MLTEREQVGRRRAALFATVAALVLLAGACIGTSPSGQTIEAEVPRNPPVEEFLPSTVNATNAFATDLYRSVAQDQGNFVSSPYAIALALGMARAGSAGTTLEQFDTVLHASETANLDQGLNTIDLELASRSGDKSSTNRKGRLTPTFEASMWGQRGTRFKDGYLAILAGDYGAGMHVVDFQSDPENARDAINQWGSDTSGGRITEVAPRGDVTEYTRFMGVSMSYLRAPWQVPFDPANTRRAPFERGPDDLVDAQTMQINAATGLRSAQGTGWEAVEIPYLGDQLGLLVVVPTAGTLGAFESELDPNALNRIVDELEEQPIDLRVPVFQFTTSMDLTRTLERQGLAIPFTRDADFSGITSDELLDLSSVLFQGYFGIDEEGTDADTTATAQVEGAGSPAAVRMAVDRPFLFAVRDRTTGLILMMGRVVSPA